MTTAVGLATGIGGARGVIVCGWPPDVNTTNYGSSYSETPDTNFAEFQPDVGPPKRRRRMSIATDMIAFSLIMTTAEYASFINFYRFGLADGTLPFSFPLGRTGVTSTYVFTGQAPAMKYVDFGLYEVSITMRNVP